MESPTLTICSNHMPSSGLSQVLGDSCAQVQKWFQIGGIEFANMYKTPCHVVLKIES